MTIFKSDCWLESLVQGKNRYRPIGQPSFFLTFISPKGGPTFKKLYWENRRRTIDRSTIHDYGDQAIDETSIKKDNSPVPVHLAIV